MEHYDAIIVGARCAGTTLRASLARTILPDWLEQAERISDVRVAPRRCCGGSSSSQPDRAGRCSAMPDTSSTPGSAQGICDAIEQALHLAEALNGEDPVLRDYRRWRDERAERHYEWSFVLGRLPRQGVTDPIADGLRDDPAAAVDFRDTLTRRAHPSEVFSGDRLATWFTAAASSS
jgi:flavin-dependent dehydrogenase